MPSPDKLWYMTFWSVIFVLYCLFWILKDKS